MTSRATGIVVGVDGSSTARQAAVWAAEEARARRLPLRLVHAYAVPDRGYPRFLVSFHGLRRGLRFQGKQALDEATEAVRQAVPEVRPETDMIEAVTAVAMLRESHRARMLVLGSRGLGGFTGMLVGSVTMAVAAHARAPVVVVRGHEPDKPAHREGPVVVGVDDSDTSRAAVEFGCATASLWSLPLIALHSITDADAEAAEAGGPGGEERSRLSMAEALAGTAEQFPDVEIRQDLSRRRASRALLEHSVHDAALVVVGSRGRGGFTGLLLGSTSQTVLTHSSCPTAVVHPPGHDHSPRVVE